MIEHFLKLISKKEVYGVIFIIALGVIIAKLSNLIVDTIVNHGRTELDKKKRTTVVRLFQNVSKYVIIFIIIMIILDLNGVNTKSFLAGLGVVGAVVGLSLQDTLKDLINGITIIVNNFYVVGDIVRYGDFQGEIIELGLKTTKIKNITGEVKVISNRNITEIVNLSQKSACFTLKIPTSYNDKLDKVELVFKDITKEVKTIDNVKNAAFLGIEEFSDSSINYSFRVWCNRGTQWDLKRQVLKVIKKHYDENNLTIPYQQIEVHNGKKV